MSFRLKIVLGLLIIQILLMVILVWSSLNFLRISNEVELSNRAASTASILASTLSTEVADGDSASLNAKIKEVLTQPDIAYIRITRKEEMIAGGGDPSALERPFVEDFLFDDVTDGIYDVSSEIVEGGASLGQVQIGIVTSEVNDIMAAARREMSTIAVIGLGVSILFSLMLGNYFARQLTRLKDATRRIASGDIGYQLAVAGNDELAQTANAFNTMSRKLAMLYSEKQSALNRARLKADELHESERRIHAVLHHAMDAIITFDERGILESFNPAGERIFGYTTDECVGRQLGMLVPEPYLSEHDSAMKEFLRSGDPRIFGATREIEGRRKDGSVFPMEIDISQVEIAGRHLFIGIARDITRRRSDELELRKAQEASLQSSRNKFEFIANISQEIRTPVNDMLSSINLLSATDLAPEIRSRVENIQSSGNSLITVINDMLDFSRIEAGKLALESISFDLWRTVDAVYRMFRDAAEKKGVNLVYIVPLPIPTALRGDPTRLRQLLINLLDNALKFTEKGEVVLRLGVTEESPDHAVLRFDVEDTGVGIAPSVQQRIFEMFSHTDMTMSPADHRSSGLGLMISKQLAEMMGGGIGVSSEVGRGSNFWFTARFDKQPAGQEPPDYRLENLSDLKILIVNPDSAACESMRGMIQESGLQSRCIEDGMKALNELCTAAGRGKPYDMVIFDRIISGMSGLQFAHAIRGDKRIARTRMIMIAATGYRGDGEEVREAGIQGYLTTPVESEQLHDCIAAVARLDGEARDGFITKHALAASGRTGLQEYALVVSDDYQRQKLLLARLERLDFRTALAVNAEEALAATEHNIYRLVVVDNESKQLLSTAQLREIRSREQHGVRHIPIVVIVSPAASRDEQQAYCSAGADECFTGMAGIEDLGKQVTAGGGI